MAVTKTRKATEEEDLLEDEEVLDEEVDEDEDDDEDDLDQFGDGLDELDPGEEVVDLTPDFVAEPVTKDLTERPRPVMIGGKKYAAYPPKTAVVMQCGDLFTKGLNSPNLYGLVDAWIQSSFKPQAANDLTMRLNSHSDKLDWEHMWAAVRDMIDMWKPTFKARGKVIADWLESLEREREKAHMSKKAKGKMNQRRR